MKRFVFALLFLVVAPLFVIGADFTPSGNINGRNVYNIYNFTNVTSNQNFCVGALCTSDFNLARINSVNTTSNVQSLGFLTSGQLNTSFAFSGGDVNWTQLQYYPTACPAGTYLTQLNDSVTCTSIIYQSSAAGWTNTSTTTATELPIITSSNITFTSSSNNAKITWPQSYIQYFSSSPDRGLRYEASGISGGWFGIHDFYTGSNGGAATLAMRIKNNRVGVGTDSPSQALHVVGSVNVSGASSDLFVARNIAVADGGSITVTSSTNNQQLLRFETDRAWAFYQTETGANTRLALRTLNADKTFEIQNAAASTIFAFDVNTIPRFRIASDTTNITSAQITTSVNYVTSANINLTVGCVFAPGGGKLCGNSSAIWLTSPNGLTTITASN